MSCPNNDCLEPCEQNPCDPNPCYQDCGCLNPTTFECVTLPGVYSSIGITNDMNGKQVLAAITTAINNIVPGNGSSASDVKVKVSGTDTTSDYLNQKLLSGLHTSLDVINPGANEKLKVRVTPNTLISTNAGNILELGTDGKLRVFATQSSNGTHITEGVGITITGTGSTEDPYVLSANSSVQIQRDCFDGVWRNIPISSVSDNNVRFVSGTPRYRINYNGSIDFKGSATYNVDYGAYSTGARERTITFGSLPVTCLTAIEQTTLSDIKLINYIDPQAGVDQMTQQYGYIIRKNNNNIQIKFQSSFLSPTTKTVVVNFDGAISHPTI